MQIKAKKSLGQNFLIDKNILKKIVSVGDISSGDNILEIGPGTGNLTEYIIKSKPNNIKKRLPQPMLWRKKLYDLVVSKKTK